MPSAEDKEAGWPLEPPWDVVAAPPALGRDALPLWAVLARHEGDGTPITRARSPAGERSATAALALAAVTPRLRCDAESGEPPRLLWLMSLSRAPAGSAIGCLRRAAEARWPE